MIDKEKIIEILREHPEVIISALEKAGYKVARVKDVRIAYKRLNLEIVKTNERVAKIELEIGQINERITKVEFEIAQIKERITKVELEIAKINEKIAKIELEIAKIHESISQMESRLLKFFISAIFIQFFFIALTYFGTIFILIQTLKK